MCIRDRAKAAELAEKLWEAAPAAPDAHPYLRRKEVPALGLRLARDGRLLVPVLDAAGKAQSLQFIAGDGSKRFLSCGKTAGGFLSLIHISFRRRDRGRGRAPQLSFVHGRAAGRRRAGGCRQL